MSVARFVGDQIRLRRMRMGITQLRLHELLGGSSQSAVSGWERAEICPDLDTLYRLAKVFNCTVHELLPEVA